MEEIEKEILQCHLFREHGQSGHLRREGKILRCQCIAKVVARKKLGPIFSESVPKANKLGSLVGVSLTIEGPLNEVKGYVTAAMMPLIVSGKTVLVVDIYQMLEVFLQQEDNIASNSEFVAPDILIVLVGFGDPPNKYLPNLLTQHLKRRFLHNRPTWLVLGVPREQLTSRYSAEVTEAIREFKAIATS